MFVTSKDCCQKVKYSSLSYCHDTEKDLVFFSEKGILFSLTRKKKRGWGTFRFIISMWVTLCHCSRCLKQAFANLAKGV